MTFLNLSYDITARPNNVAAARAVCRMAQLIPPAKHGSSLPQQRRTGDMPRGRKKVPTSPTSHTEDLLSSWQRERPDLDLTEFLLGIVVMRTGRLLEQNFGQTCRRKFGISSADMRVLFALRRAGAPFARRPTDLFKALLVTSGAMTKQVDRLEELGLVKRLVDPDYGGGFLIRLTDEGKSIADKATDELALNSLIGPAMRSISSSDIDAVGRHLKQILKETETAFNGLDPR